MLRGRAESDCRDVCKWALLLAVLPCVLRAWQGIYGPVSAAAEGRLGAGADASPAGAAVHSSVLYLLFAAALLAAAWGISFCWRCGED